MKAVPARIRRARRQGLRVFAQVLETCLDEISDPRIIPLAKFLRSRDISSNPNLNVFFKVPQSRNTRMAKGQKVILSSLSL